MMLKIIDWKGVWKFSVTIICGLHFEITSTISCKKYDEKCYDQWYLAYYIIECVQLLKNTELLKGWRTVIR